MVCTAAAASVPEKIFGNIGASYPANRRRASIGAARRAMTISMSASRNGRRRTPFGFGRTDRPRWCSLYRTLVIALALAEILVEGGERVGIPGLMRPTGSRNVIDRMAQALVHDRAERASLPPSFAPSPLAEVVLLSDLWSDFAEVRKTLTQLSGSGARGHVIQVVDPAEETFPFWGRIEFVEPEGAGRVTAGRAQAWRTDYQERVQRHRAQIRAETDRLAWSFIIHRTDHAVTELLLALHARIGAAFRSDEPYLPAPAARMSA